MLNVLPACRGSEGVCNVNRHSLDMQEACTMQKAQEGDVGHMGACELISPVHDPSRPWYSCADTTGTLAARGFA